MKHLTVKNRANVLCNYEGDEYFIDELKREIAVSIGLTLLEHDLISFTKNGEVDKHGYKEIIGAIDVVVPNRKKKNPPESLQNQKS